MSFADRLLRRRTGLDAITGFNGGSLEDQLQPRPQPEPQQFLQDPQAQAQPTMADRYMANAQPVDESVNQPAQPPATNPFQQRLMQGRSRVADPTEFDAQHLRELESKKDPRWEKILNAASAGIASAAQGGAPIHRIPTRRERDIETVGGRLGRDIALDKNRIALEQGAMVPFQLPDGSTTMVPAKTAGTLASRQYGQQASLSERKRMNDAHIKRWSGMGAHEAAQDAQKLLNSGTADDNDDLKDEIVRRLGLPAGTKLPNHDKKQVQTDAQGNFILVDPKSGEVQDVVRPTGPPQPPTTNPADATRPRTATEPVQSFKATQEAGKDERSRLGRAAAMQRALVMAQAQGARMGDPAEYESLANQADQDAKDAKAQADEVGPRRAAPYLAEAGRAKARAVQLRELATKAKGGQGGQTAAAQQQSAGGSFDLGGWKKAHPNATEQQIQSVRSKAKARNLSIVE